MKTLLSRKSYFFLIIILSAAVRLQAQVVDTGFKPPSLIRSTYITEMKEQPDGKILMTGNLNLYDGKEVPRLIRINPDGSLDKSFNPNVQFVFAFEPYPDGGTIILGIDDAAQVRLVRLKENGKVHKSINLSDLGFASAMLTLPDGRILIGTSAGGLWCFKSNLMLDKTFSNSATFANNQIEDMKVQGEKILVTGSFTRVNGMEKNHMVRIDSNGFVDPSFDIGTGAEFGVSKIYVQPDQKILFQNAQISTFNGQSYTSNPRLNSDGSIDESFHSDFEGYVNKVFYQDNKILVSNFYTIARLNDDGSRDVNFNQLELPSHNAISPLLLKNNDLVVANVYNRDFGYGIIKYDAFGSIVANFKPPVAERGNLRVVTEQGDKLLIAGSFLKVNDVFSYDIARLNADGSVDPSFVFRENFSGIDFVKVIAGNEMLISNSNHFLNKLDANGNWIGNFSFDLDFSLFPLKAIKLQPDGKVVIGTPNGIGRWNADGTRDLTFSMGSGICCGNFFGDAVVAFQSDGKIIYATDELKSYDGHPVSKIARLNTDGSFDPSFNSGSGPVEFGLIQNIETLNNDELFVSGFFSDFSGVRVPSAVKLQKDGAVDDTFVTNLLYPDDFAFAFDGQGFRDKIAIMMTSNFPSLLQFRNYDGTLAEDMVSPSEITGINGTDILPRLSSPDDNTLYILGDIKTIENGDNPVPLVRIIFPMLTAQQQNNTSLEFNVFPNPSSKTISIDAESARVRIIAFDGQTKLDADIDGKQDLIDVSTLPPGFYFITVQSGNKTGRAHFIKE